MNGDNFSLSTVSHWDNYRQLHFLQDGAPPHFAVPNRFFPSEVTFLLAPHTYACFFMVLAFALSKLTSADPTCPLQNSLLLISLHFPHDVRNSEVSLTAIA